MELNLSGKNNRMKSDSCMPTVIVLFSGLAVIGRADSIRALRRQQLLVAGDPLLRLVAMLSRSRQKQPGQELRLEIRTGDVGLECA